VSTTAKLVAARAGVKSYLRAYQSAGRTPEPWLGPEIGELIRARAGAGVKRILVAPIGFVCDHTEILFDIDVQATQIARQAGVTLRRTQSLNSSPTFIRALAALVAQSVGTPQRQ
jgi:ferrochelatase